MGGRWSRGLALLLMFSVLAAPRPADAAPSCVSVGWEQIDANCAWTYLEYQQASSEGSGHTWYVTLQPDNGGIPRDDLICADGGESGLWHDVFMDGNDVGDVCVPDSESDQVNIAELVIAEFKRMTWPKSQLVVQPPGGKTLVNFKTNFYTLNTQAISRHVTVATRKVTIEAFPVSYVFRFGDGSNLGTSSPGRPYPSLDVTHVYQRTGKVGVRVDTTYTGRYRIGDGDWVDIEETLTVPGDGQALRILEAVPQLVLE